MIKRLQKLERVRKRQRQIATARLQQSQQRADAVESKLSEMQATAQARASTGARAGELQAWASGSAAIGRELERARAVVRHVAIEVQQRSFAEQRAGQLLERARDERRREIDRKEQQENDDRAGRRS